MLAKISPILAYGVFLSWALITILPLVWMGYSSFKTNEELVRDIYRLPNALIFNQDHEFQVIARSLNVVLNYDPETDPRERIILESTTVAPTRRLMVYFLIKEDMPPAIQALVPGDKLVLRDLPFGTRTRIGWEMIWFYYSSAFIRGTLAQKFVNSLIYAGLGTLFIVFFGLMIGFSLAKLGFPR